MQVVLRDEVVETATNADFGVDHDALFICGGCDDLVVGGGCV